jgi:hypothetical protein
MEIISPIIKIAILPILPSLIIKIYLILPIQSYILVITIKYHFKNAKRKNKYTPNVFYSLIIFRYQIALAKNPRCIVLWKKYLDWLKK